jgi:apolipoprotein N-acyltransferase
VLAAAASGVLYALCFPPLELFPLAFVALVPLLWALAQVGVVAGAALGLLFSLTAGACLAPWLPGTLSSFFELGHGAALASALGVYLLCGFPYAGLGAGIAWWSRRGPVPPLVVAAAFAACEWLRLDGPIPTPWALLAYTQAPSLRLVQSADLVGALGLGALIAALNGCVAWAIVARDTRPRRVAQVLALPAAALAAAWIYGGVRLAQPFGDGDEIRVALVQGAVTPEWRFEAEHREENLARHLALTSELAPARPQLVLWPELSVEFAVGSDPTLWRRVEDASRALGAELLVGAPYPRTRALVVEPTNAALLLRDGRIVDRHEKVALMPFSEMRPAALPIGRDLFRPGQALRPLASRVGALGVLLCSEVLLPQLAGRLAAGGAELLVNPSNDDWFANEAASRHQVAATVFRAVETRRYVLRPSTRGPSSVVDPHGRVLALAPYGSPARLEARVRRVGVHTWYERLTQAATPSASGLAFVSLFCAAALRRRDS